MRRTGMILVLLAELGFAAAVQGQGSGSPVVLRLGPGQAHVQPFRQGITHTGGGMIDVAQPSPDVITITMTGAAVAAPHPCKETVGGFQFELHQQFEVVFTQPGIQGALLLLEGRVMGLLRSHCRGGGVARQGPALAVLSGCRGPLAQVSLPPHQVSGGADLSINDHARARTVVVGPGLYELQQIFEISASHPQTWQLCKTASVEFAPDPAIDPLWLSYWEPFHGADKQKLGFKIVIQVVPLPTCSPTDDSSSPAKSKNTPADASRGQKKWEDLPQPTPANARLDSSSRRGLPTTRLTASPLPKKAGMK